MPSALSVVVVVNDCYVHYVNRFFKSSTCRKNHSSHPYENFADGQYSINI